MNRSERRAFRSTRGGAVEFPFEWIPGPADGDWPGDSGKASRGAPPPPPRAPHWPEPEPPDVVVWDEV